MTPGSLVGGKYRLLRLIGEGAMGQVWAAVNESTGGEAALKLLPRPREDLRKRLLREARACGKLRHRNIIDVHDIGETAEGDPFLVMALLSGETLAELLEKKRRLDPPYAAQIARDIARALAAAHRAGLVHRDLKPANVFLHHEDGDDDVVVKVLDFGVVKDLGRADGLATVAGVTVGSPAYMSPEQALASPDLDHRADIWALGVVLFEMLTGKRPFEGDSHQVVMKIMRAPIPAVTQLLRGAPAGLAELVARCLERDLGKRLASAADLADALDRHAHPAGAGRSAAEAVSGAAPASPVDADLPTLRMERATLSTLDAPTAPPPPAHPLSGTIRMSAAPPVPASRSGTVPAPSDLHQTVRLPPPPPAPLPPALPPPPARSGLGLSSTAPLVRPSAAPPPRPTARRRAVVLAAIGLGGALLLALAVAVLRAVSAPAAAPSVARAFPAEAFATRAAAGTPSADTPSADPAPAQPSGDPLPSETTATAPPPTTTAPRAPSPVPARTDDRRKQRGPGWLYKPY